ncbi:sodium:solute symporter [Stigmatella aurantiaca]|uniref:Electrogenic sodium monocarboxylate cotransporter, putative n=1 Tax=Stigmatella aurantiaca (strain DW4/3-1) TaxID=378806 RepID=Q092G7_STIAD|nr:sodium:solute symporter [Stigmatella aurantiaca]ADO69701.1 Transporter, solute:sodium symporter (SSS) family [Stigmatella aurantiaca DW4/3-1]EAU66619.1 electrogenic sodium monocarboxylate cotransporter, putative [Stigmatella aurantiaca DW4/3-1]
MTLLDWLVLIGTTAFIVGWGLWRTRGESTTTEGFLRGGHEMRWPTIGLSVMATQASAITFLSVPGQAYEDGMRFVQFYFGLPIAMVIISAVFVPIYYRLNVLTAYEYLESRFDLKTRLLGALLFLIQRGLASGITLYAPSIILSAIFGWPLEPTIVLMGALVILYTVTGGSKAVSQTQKQQMVVMLGGMAVAAIVIVWKLPENVSFGQAVDVAGALGRMNVVSFNLDFQDRYNVWSGITGGLFLSLSYFGTDQSQVGRYLTGRSITESRLGLLFNGVLKIPMQFLILFVGLLVFVFYQFTAPPLLFNQPLRARVQATAQAGEFAALEEKWAQVQAEKRVEAERYVAAREAGDGSAEASSRERLQAAARTAETVRKEAKAVVSRALPGSETKDSDYIFISFVKDWMPSGLVGLLVTVILAAAMSSISSELNALGATTTVDFYRRVIRRDATDRQFLVASKLCTVLWGFVAIAFASFASLLDNLIQAVNILGSLFYGTVLGLFLVAFFLRRVRGNAVFLAALLSQGGVLGLFTFSGIGYLWFNVIGCALVVVLGVILQALLPGSRSGAKPAHDT